MLNILLNSAFKAVFNRKLS